VVTGWQQRAFHSARLMAERHELTFVSFAREPATPTGRAELDASAAELSTALGGAPVHLVSDADCGIRTTPSLDDWAPPLASAARLLDSPLPIFVRRWWSERLVATLREVGAADHDAVWGYRVWMTEHARAAGCTRIVADVDDIHSDVRIAELRGAPRYKSKPLHYAHAVMARRYEKRLLDRFPHLVVSKPSDRHFFPARGRERVHVVPNGVVLPSAPDPEPGPEAGPPTLLFVGMLSHTPNVDAARWLCAEIMPRVWARRADVRLQVVGQGDPADVLRAAAGDPRVAVAVAPPDVAPFYRAATLVVAPVRIGGGTRIKVLEALGRGRALVSTRFAAESVEAADGEELVYADDADAFAAACLALLDDAPRRARLGRAGRALVARSWTWDAIAPALHRVLDVATADVPRAVV
jgi:glycosyltransferase involved in cell wall biosynthesis